MPAKYGHVKRETGSEKRKARGGACLSVVRYVRFARSSFQETNKGRKRNAGKRRSPTAASCDAARAHSERARLTAFHHGSHLRELFHPKGSASGQASWGRGLNGRYPPSPVPVQGCTSHPGRNAGRHDAQAAREQAANPPAGTALAPMTRCASAPCPSRERGVLRNRNGDDCQGVVSEKDTPRFDLSPQWPDSEGGHWTAFLARPIWAITRHPVGVPADCEIRRTQHK
jgi:hypothetical protein